jgi:hypothetical protein
MYETVGEISASEAKVMRTESATSGRIGWAGVGPQSSSSANSVWSVWIAVINW